MELLQKHGRRQESRDLLRRIIQGNWQPRFREIRDKARKSLMSIENPPGADTSSRYKQQHSTRVGQVDPKSVDENLTRGDREFGQRRLEHAKSYYLKVLEEQLGIKEIPPMSTPSRIRPTGDTPP